MGVSRQTRHCEEMKLKVLVVFVSFFAFSNASCFGRDTGFNPKLAKPVISQPSRSDPSKVMVDWSKILKNPQCVDSFNVVVWADGTPASSAKKYQVDKNTKSKIIEIQPCVGYRFAVETNEKNTVGMKTIKSGEQVFKTAGSSTSMRIDSSRFHVTYHWDPIKRVTDLKMATISFPREILPGASCLDYIQVTGSQVKSSSRPRSSSVSRSRSFSWKHLGQSSPSIQAGNAATLPMPISTGNSYSSVARGGSSARGPVANSWSRSSSSSSSFSPPGSPTSSRSLPSMSAPIAKPNFANTLPRGKGGASHNVGPVRVQPPFLNPMIDINVAVKDCAEYNFEVKFYAPTSKEVGKVSNIRLPALADLPGYVPPPITSVMSITYGNSGKPVYGVKTASGVTSACLPAYFEAYDAYTQRLENEVKYQTKEGNRVQGLVTDSQTKLDSSQEELLRKTGCVCTSPHIEFSTTNAEHKKKHPQVFGHYHFQGMHKNKPFYKLMGVPGTFPAPTTSRPGSKKPAPTTKRPSTPVKPIFLYWDEKNKQWLFGETLGGKSGIDFSTAGNSLAKCPGDPPASGTWQYKSSVLRRWKKDTTLKVSCLAHKH